MEVPLTLFLLIVCFMFGVTIVSLAVIITGKPDAVVSLMKIIGSIIKDILRGGL